MGQPHGELVASVKLVSVREGRGRWIAFGVIGLLARIVVAATPITSLNVLAVLLGILFIVMGVFEIVGGFMIRHEVHTLELADA